MDVLDCALPRLRPLTLLIMDVHNLSSTTSHNLILLLYGCPQPHHDNLITTSSMDVHNLIHNFSHFVIFSKLWMSDFYFATTLNCSQSWAIRDEV